MQLHEKVLLAYNLRKTLSPHNLARHAWIAIRIYLLSAKKGRNIRQISRGSDRRIGHTLGARLLRRRKSSLLIVSTSLAGHGITGAKNGRGGGRGGGGARRKLRCGLALEHAVGHGHDLACDRLEHFCD